MRAAAAWSLSGLAACLLQPDAAESASADTGVLIAQVVPEPPAGDGPTPAEPDPGGSTGAPEPSKRPPWPLTELPLALLATMAAPSGGDSRATMRDAESGVIATYRVGDEVRGGVEVLSIEPGVVELSNAGEAEYLTISTDLVELDADDVFYPDLLDDLSLSHDMGEAVQMPDGLEYAIKSRATAWGTPRTVAMLRDAIRTYARSVRGEPKVYIGDLSLRAGGPFPPHLSHQDGRDVDIGYVIDGPGRDRRRFVTAHAGNLDLERTWALLSAILATGAVKYVFMDYDLQGLMVRSLLDAGEDPGVVSSLFQYPRGRRASHGVIRHWKSHRNHFHVRFRE